ncbi:MAG TPA: SRPBCC family protein, partial [Methanosarcina sp.]|nr:SRPBCC family protein [Methanosarcina sp.]
VWKFFTDRENIKLWQPTLTKVEPMSGAEGQPGAESKWTYEENGREFSLTEKLLQYEEPSRYESSFENTFASNTVNNIFAEQNAKETLWTAETEYKFKTPLMKILGPFFKKNYVLRSHREMERFKETVEKE